MKCYRNGGCGSYEMYSCSECPASKPEYAKKTTKTAQQMFEDLGFTKNKSECYNEQHVLYERGVKNIYGTVSDIFKVEFKDKYVIYTNTTMRAIAMDIDLIKAITQQLEEMRNINEH